MEGRIKLGPALVLFVVVAMGFVLMWTAPSRADLLSFGGGGGTSCAATGTPCPSPVCSSGQWNNGGTCTATATAAATASPVPSPTVVTALSFNAPGNNPTVTIPSGGSTPVIAGDCAIGTNYSTSAAPVLGVGSALLSNFSALGVNMQTFYRYITAADIAAGHWSTTQLSGTPFCTIFVRHAICIPDAYSAGAAASSSSNQPPSMTTTVNGDLTISVNLLGTGGGTFSYAAPSGYTNQVEMDPVNGVSTGCAIDTKLQTTAGAIQPGVGTLGGTGPSWGSAQVGIPNDGDVN